MKQFNEMQTIKRRFFAMRNGAIAENMRRLGAKYRIIFGLNLPQIIEIATETGVNKILAEALWDNKSTRESLLIAPMLYPREEFNIEIAQKWISEVTSAEVGDVLCHRLLKHTIYAWDLSKKLTESTSSMERYIAFRLVFNLLPNNMAEVKVYAKNELEKKEPLTQLLCNQLIDEIDFLEEEQN